MKAIVHHRYGGPDVLELEEIEKPIPADDQILIKVRAASVNPVDKLFEGSSLLVRMITGLRKPKDPRVGHDVAGQVESVGKNVSAFKEGDEVFGVARGAFAEYACNSEAAFAVKPGNATFEQAAAVPVAGLTALQGLRKKGKVQRGQKVLINGAAGGVGTFAVQIAKVLGADVTAVCSTRNVEMVRSLGADRVIDYTREDFTKGSERYDLIFDCMSNHSLSAYRRILNANGMWIGIGGPAKVWVILIIVLKARVLSWFVSQNFVLFISRRSQEDLTCLRELMEAGKVTPVIDRRYTLSEVPDAMRYLKEGHARGKIVITLESR
jgi:NADPH:quinone reductase-like Zn-dependent oxidoreductase